MVAYRNRLVAEISVEFDTVLEKLRASRSSDPEAIESLLKKLRQLDEARSLIMRFPVWPFDTGTIRRFFGLVLSPLLPGAVSTLTDWLLGRT